MAAALTITPTEVQVGDLVHIAGTGFLPSTKVVVTIPERGVEFDINSDASGGFSSDSVAGLATGTLTSDATNVAADDTVTVGSVTYTFKASVTTTANQVKIGASAAASLANLKSAINADPAQVANYGSATVVNPDVGAGALTATTLQLYAKVGGTAGNALATTETSAHLSFGATTLTGGAAATGVNPLQFVAQVDYPFTVNATDGTNSASAKVQVWTE